MQRDGARDAPDGERRGGLTYRPYSLAGFWGPHAPDGECRVEAVAEAEQHSHEA